MIQVSAQHKVLVIPYRQDVETLLPHARPFQRDGTQLLAVPHGRDEVRLLRNLGIKAPAPILWQYDWCGDTPFQTQRDTAAMLTTNPRAYVLNDMGTGKTRATLHALNFLMRTGDVSRALVVAPLSTLTTVWQSEIYSHFPGRSACMLYARNRAQRLKLLDVDADIYIINHDGLRVIQEELAQRTDINALILDELAVYRTPGAKRSRAMRQFAKRFKYVWGLTGSPTPNEPSDAWSQAKIVTPHRAPQYFKQFRNATMVQVSQFTWIPKRGATDIVADMLKPSVRFTRDETVELPPVIQQDRYVALSTSQQKVYDQLLKHCRMAYAAHEVNAANEGVLMSKLLQVCSGAVYSNRGVIRIDAKARLQMLSDIVDEAGQKVLVFVPFVHALDIVSDHLRKQCSVATVSGATTKAERDDIFNKFQQTPDPHAIVAHPGTMAHGLTLTAANCIVWYSPTASLDTYTQANARISRPGQLHKQLIVNMIGAAVEKKIYARLKAKHKVQGVLLDMLEGVDEGT